MPYDSTSELPDQTSHLTSKEKRAFKHAFNSAVSDGKSEKSAFKIAWHAAKGAGERSPNETVGKHLRLNHDQQDHDPTKGAAKGESKDPHPSTRRQPEKPIRERGEKFAEDGQQALRDLRRSGLEGVASQVERGGRRAGHEARSFTQEATGGELLTTGAYTAAAGAGALITRSYIPKSPTTAVAYGAYSLAMLALAGGTANDVLNRQGRGIDIGKKADPEEIEAAEVAGRAESMIEEIAREIEVTPAELIEDLGNWLDTNEYQPDELKPETMREFLAEQYSVGKRVGDTSEGGPYAADMDELTIDGEIAKVDADLGQVFGWASITKINGEPVVDLQNDYLETHELEKAAYDYVLKSRVGGEMHERMKKSAPKQVGTLIESMVLTDEKIEKMGLPKDTPHGWWVGFQVSKDDIGSKAWENVKKGKYTGFSIHGMGKRMEKRLDEVGKKLFDRTPQEYEGWLKRMERVSGVPAEQIDADLKAFLSEEGIGNPTDDQVHEFLMEAYSSSDNADDVTKAIAKHLADRHEQTDHALDDSVHKANQEHAMDHQIGTALFAKAAEKATSTEQFLANTEEIGKALASYDTEASQFFEDFTTVAKHLIGNHDQEDHDPTKKKNKGDHSRKEHSGGDRAKSGGKIGAALAGGAGLAALATPGGRTAARMFGQRGAQAARMGSAQAQYGAWQAANRAGPAATRAGDALRRLPGQARTTAANAQRGAQQMGRGAQAGYGQGRAGWGALERGGVGPMGQYTRSQIAGNLAGQGVRGAGQGLRSFDNWSLRHPILGGAAVGGVFGAGAGGINYAAERRRMKKSLTTREREVLAKYLGPFEEDDS